MSRQYSPEKLRCLRNEIDITDLIANVLHVPHKVSEGYFRFLCPICSEFDSATNPRTNLARCFRCERNFNPIDMVMIIHDSSFVEAAKYLSRLLPLKK
jgi:DNA primase